MFYLCLYFFGFSWFRLPIKKNNKKIKIASVTPTNKGTKYCIRRVWKTLCRPKKRRKLFWKGSNSTRNNTGWVTPRYNDRFRDGLFETSVHVIFIINRIRVISHVHLRWRNSDRIPIMFDEYTCRYRVTCGSNRKRPCKTRSSRLVLFLDPFVPVPVPFQVHRF